ncbi:hypothetical protein H0V99_00770 [Candidatus Saccharibacteria bacterium]|nr:hypothetical protein [Candidatus Saccharibacteria bacterium]
MRRTAKIKPKNGFSQFIHWALVSIIPLLLFVLVRLSIVPLAYIVVLLSKWRMFAVRPRHWPANIRANSIDIIVGLSFVVFIAQAPSQAWQLVWVLCYEIWLIIIKPRSAPFWTSIQAGLGQLLGLVALYLLWGSSSLILLVAASWALCYLAARHFFSSYDEPLSSMLSHIWAYIAAALTWVLAHWLLYYGFLAQPVLLLSIIAYSLATLYYLENNDRLSTLIRREILLIMSAVIVVVIMFSDWGDKAV